MCFLFRFGVLGAALLRVALGGPASAQSFVELEARLADHPSLVALTHHVDAGRERSVAATALPDPVVSVGIANFPILDPSFSRFLPTHKAVGIRQEFPNRAGRDARAGEARARAELTDRIRAAQFASLRGELIALLHDRARIRRQREMTEAWNRKVDELSDVVETEIDAGRPAVFRLAEIEAERARVLRVLVDLDREEAELEARLIDLVDLVPDTPAPLVVPGDQLEQDSDFHAVRVAEAGIRVADHAVRVAEAAWRPDWGAQVIWQQRVSGEDFSGDDWITGMVTFTVPLRAGQGKEPRLRAARADRAAASSRRLAAARSAVARHAAETAAWQAARHAISVLERNIAAIEDEIATQLAIYESGVGDYAPIIDGEIAILELRAAIAAEHSRESGAIARRNALLIPR